ncbi:hypothetical protein MMC20_002303 [Loxospora ochrophaea]|nr:hypothetical protein [Loxospora ochrophaea]
MAPPNNCPVTGITKERIVSNASQCFSDVESSLDSSSTTPSPTEDPKSGSTSSFSDLESPQDEAKLSSVTFIAGLKIDAEDTETKNDVPLLKGAGKSDCAVSVVTFHECEKNVSVASLSDESSGRFLRTMRGSGKADGMLQAWNSEAMQVILKNAGSIALAPHENEVLMNGSRAAQVQKALRRPTLPRRYHSEVSRKESRSAGTCSPRQHVNDSTLRRLSSDLWAVRKQAFRCGKQDGSRLLKQVQKQVIYSATCRTHPIIAMVTTPEVYGLKVSMDELSEGSVIVDMEYIPFGDVLSAILEQDKTIHDWFIGAAISVIDQELTQSSNVRLASILPKFFAKASNIKTNLPGSNLLTVDELQEITQYFDLILAHYASLQELEVPVGTCHGDLTLQNMLVDPINRELCVFDFLDSFVVSSPLCLAVVALAFKADLSCKIINTNEVVFALQESPLQDIAKLLQDCRHQWFFTQVDIPEKDLPRVVASLESFNKRIASSYFKYSFWEALPLFEFFTLARILPYMTQTIEKQCILNGLRRLIQGLDEKTSDITQLADIVDDDVLGTTTVIIPALGNDMGNLYTDSQIKLLAMNQNGRPLIVDCISNLAVDRVSSIIVAVLKPFVELSCGTTAAFEELFRSLGEEKYQKMRFYYAKDLTQDAVETVTLAINAFNIRGPVFVKAADNGFVQSVDIGNYLSVSGVLRDQSPIEILGHGFRPGLMDVTSKNFVSFFYDNVISNIAHKPFVSSQFCCGGWAFLKAEDFLSATKTLRSLLQNARSISSSSDARSPLHIVDAVWQLMSQGHIFFGAKASAYDDWGTQATWMVSRGCE